jgi:hypothetical protein
MNGRIYLSDPPTGLDAYSQNALELPHRVMPSLSPGLVVHVTVKALASRDVRHVVVVVQILVQLHDAETSLPRRIAMEGDATDGLGLV